MSTPVVKECLGERFSRLRERLGMTQSALAAPTYTVSYVSQIEAGRRTPSAKALTYFADRLGVSPSYLETGMPDGLEEELAYRIEEARGLCRTGEPNRAFEVASDVLSQSEHYGLAHARGAALAVSADALVLLGEMRRAIDRYEAALEEGLGEREQGIVIAALAAAYRSVGDLAYAADLVESKLRDARGAPMDPSVSAELNATLVSIYFERGDMTRAEVVVERALAAAREGASLRERADVLWSASRIAAERKRWDDALALARDARLIMERLNDRFRLARVHSASAFVCLEADPPRIDEAADHLAEAESILTPDGPGRDLAFVFAEQGRLALLSDREDAAVDYADKALANVGDDMLQRGTSLYLRGRALAGLGRLDESLEDFREAAAVFAKVGARQHEAACYREIGEMQLDRGDLAGAVEEFRAGLEALEPRRSRA